MRVQRVPADHGGCHLDLHVDLAVESMDHAADRVAGLGARLRHRDGDLVVFDSPGGFRFCLVPWAAEATVPGPVDVGAGGANRLDQLCLDIPAPGFPAECAFWASLTGWDLRPGGLPEFAYLVRPAAIAVRLLFQRRLVAGADDRVSGHPDFACDNTVTLAEQHTAAGARVTAQFPHWVTMADPTGRPYCLTTRDPRTGTLRPTP
ncbi:MAG TPA: VOC family protein [Catenuloplanes sp.]